MFIAAWVQDGWIEIGHDSNNGSFIRVFDEGGLVWESDKPYTSIDKALADAGTGYCRVAGLKLKTHILIAPGVMNVGFNPFSSRESM